VRDLMRCAALKKKYRLSLSLFPLTSRNVAL
jgi:hypothetical protein